MSNNDFYNQPSLLFDQIADSEDQIVLTEDEWSLTEAENVCGFQEEREQLAKEDHHRKTAIVMRKRHEQAAN